MTKKPGTEALQQRIALLEAEALRGRQAMEALRESETKYRQLFEHMTEGVALHELACDENGRAVDYRILETNPSYHRHTGLPEGPLQGKLATVLYGTETPPYLKEYEQVARTGEPLFFETFFPPLNKHFSITVFSPKRGFFATVFEDITERKRIDAEFKAAHVQLESLWNVSALGDADLKKIADHVLESIARMTQSAYGFYGFVSENESVMTIHSWSGEAMQDCAMVLKPQHFPVCEAGVWAEAIRRREPLILNDYGASHRAKKGLPEGHVGLKNLAVVPYFTHGRITAVAAVANREGGYGQADVSQIQSFLTSIQAIVESKQSEEALRKSEALFRAVFEYSTIGKSLTAPDGRIIQVNEAFADMLGYGPAEIQGRHFEEITHPDDVATSRELVRSLLADREPQHRFEKRFIHKSGASVWTEVSMRLLRDDRGEPLHFITSIMDITERKQVEEAQIRLRRAAQRSAAEQAALAEIGRVISSTLILDRVFDQFAYITKQLIDFDTFSINLLDPESGQFQVAYLTGLPIPGLTVGKSLSITRTLTHHVVEKKCAVILHTPSLEALQKIHPEIDQTLSVQAGFRSHMQIPLFSNDIMIANLHFRSKREEAYREEDLRLAERIGMQIAGSIATARLFANQIQAEADKKTLQDQLLQSQKMESVGRLAGGVAHDFNNMLAVILGHLEIAMEEVGPENPLRDNLQQIEKAAKRSADLTRQLLAFARKQTIVPKVLDLTEVVEGALKMLRRLIGEDIQLAWLPGSALWPVRVDPSQIDQILANLCVNARDAIAGVGRISIETANVTLDEESCLDKADARPGDYVLLALCDNGHGMDGETLSHLFEPFFTTKAVGKGTGLGLATVYGIVKQNGGFIDVQSRPGQGTTFRIGLPRYRGAMAQGQGEGAAEPAIRGHETVLVVEDEPDLLELNTYMLEKLGYRVIGAATPGEALRLAEEEAGRIHLLLTDVVMPEMNGRELARKLLARDPNLKRLFMSGYTGDVIADRGVLIDGAYFIQKPFSRSALAAKVREALDREEGAQERS